MLRIESGALNQFLKPRRVRVGKVRAPRLQPVVGYIRNMPSE
jgi:hypothetical protein